MTQSDRVAFTFSTAMHAFARSRPIRMLARGEV